MLPALARLIIEASRYSQIWLTSHSAELAELIAAGALVSAMRWRIAAVRRGLSSGSPSSLTGALESGGALRLCGRQQTVAAA